MALESINHLEKSTLHELQGLVRVNLDSRDGFMHAAEKLEDQSLSAMFRGFAEERDRQADELSQYVQLNQEEAPESGSMAASLHRTWISFREALSGSNLYTVMAEAERGEDHIKAAYESALLKTAGSPLNAVLTRQLAQVKKSHDKVRDLRDALKKE